MPVREGDLVLTVSTTGQVAAEEIATLKAEVAGTIQEVLVRHAHSRMPVYDGTIDNIVGYVVARDVLALSWEKGLLVLHDILRPPHKVPESTRALDLLREMQRRRTQMAVVTDEHGREPDVPELRDLPRDVRADLGRERLPVHHGRRHARDGTRVSVRKRARGPQVTTCNLLSSPPA